MQFHNVPGSLQSTLDAIDAHGRILLLVAAAIVLVLLGGFRPRRWSGRRGRWPRLRSVGSSAAFPHAGLSDPAQQMHYIAKVGFETVPLMNREEFGVFRVLEKVMAEQRGGFRLMAQTSLGEVIRPRHTQGSNEDRDLAFRSINSKRLDFAIFDRSGRLALAIEYQGSGHYHEKSFMRDAVKKEALRKAGVTFLEVPVRFSPDELAQQVRRVLSGEPACPRPVEGLGATPSSQRPST